MRAHAAPDGTVAILFSDIEDSTIITERLGDERWLEVLREHNAMFREEIGRHDGYEVKSQGDGFMLAFPDPCQALEYAIAIQRAFAEQEREGREEALRVRMGLHTGEVIAEEGDFFGKNVILAARIAAQANGGEILVSEGDAARPGRGRGHDLRFDEGRDLELKGLAGTHSVFRAEWDRDQAAASSACARALISADALGPVCRRPDRRRLARLRPGDHADRRARAATRRWLPRWGCRPCWWSAGSRSSCPGHGTTAAIAAGVPRDRGLAVACLNRRAPARGGRRPGRCWR